MTLLDAFRWYGPVPELPVPGTAEAAATTTADTRSLASAIGRLDDASAPRIPTSLESAPSYDDLQLNADAAELINAALGQAERRLRQSFSQDVLEEARQDLAMSLLVAGPRGYIEGEPDTDEGVEALMLRALANKAIDVTRHKAFRHELVGLELVQRWTDGGGNDLVNRLVEEEQAEQVRTLQPTVRAVLTQDATPLDRESFTDMFDMMLEQTTFAQIVAREFTRHPPPLGVDHEDRQKALRRTLENRLYKRHGRALERALRRVQVSFATGTIDRELYLHATGTLRELSRRSTAGAPRTEP